MVNLWARLGDGNKALFYQEQLLKQSVYDNLFDLHPPLGETEGEREVFQIDGNFGSASGIAEMLLQSRIGEIKVLPALPNKWKSGKIKGLLAQGNIKVNIEWENGNLKAVELVSPISQKVKISDGITGISQTIDLIENKKAFWDLTD